MRKIQYGVKQYQKDVKILALNIRKSFGVPSAIFGVPRGGTILAMDLARELKTKWTATIPVANPTRNIRLLVVDDIIHSGFTRRKYGTYPFAALHCHRALEGDGIVLWAEPISIDVWIQYWWEADEAGPEENIRRIIQYIGDDPDREGLKETPARVVKSYRELFAGYHTSPDTLLKTFDNTQHRYDQIVLLKGVEFMSTCEHHMLPFFGTASVAYLPKDRIVGLSKLARLVEVFARRLQVQERMGEQIVGALMEHLEPIGAACRIEAKHMCICGRGVSKQLPVAVTQSIKGAFRDKDDARAELSQLFNH